MMRKSLLALALLGLGSCINTAAPRFTRTFDFDMDVVGEGWTGGASDFEVGREADIALVSELRNLPAPLDGQRHGQYLAGTNISDDLFIFTKKYFEGLEPNTMYEVGMAVEIASAIHSGCTVGTGPAVWVKVGALGTEPLAVEQGGRWVMNIDKGDQAAKGQFIQLGDIRNNLTGCPSPGTWDLKGTTVQAQAMRLTTDELGGFWVFLGTESGFESRHELFFNGFRLQVTVVQ
jgi:hypothetical protein